MSRVSRRRLMQLERQLNVNRPPIGRLFVLIPELWSQEDRAAFFDPERAEPLEDLVERRTGVRPTFGRDDFWAITVPASDELLAMTDEDKAAFLAAHESRPRRPDHWAWRDGADGDRRGGA